MNKEIKIAILSMTNISFHNATGSLLYRLFCNFKNENIIQICKYRHQDEAASQYNHVIPFYDFLEKQRASDNLFSKIPAAILRRLLFFLRPFIGNKKEVLKRLQISKPDILYLRVVGEPIYFLTMACFLKSKLGIPLVCHFMDDYDAQFEFESKKNIIKKIKKNIYQNKLKKTINISSHNFAISSSMKTAFEKRYGVPFSIAHNGIEKGQIGFYKNHKKNRNKNIFQIVWAGSIDPAKDDNIIKKIAQSIESINSKQSLEKKIELLLNVPGYNMATAKKIAAKYNSMRYQAYQPIEEYRKLLADAHLLLIARNFDKRSKAYTQYSFHNKLPDFLASGTPILSIGPAWDNTSRLFNKFDFGHNVGSDDPAAITKALLNIFNRYPASAELAKTAQLKAADLFSMELIRKQFQQKMLETAIFQNK
ncbi:MAG TPA: hypothetical protein ENJ95_02915 [Bacteroidetes bacterium]|nr:hypothetical protein [Bacteroidota bacterium]